MRYLAILAILALGGTAVTAAPKGTLAAVAETTAEDIQTYLGKREAAVTLDGFEYRVSTDKGKTGGRQSASAGPLIRQALVEALAKKEIAVKAQSNVTISATYVDAEAGETGLEIQVVKVTFTIRRNNPKDSLDYAHTVTNPQSVAVLLGLTTSFRPGADAAERGKILKATADAAEKGKRTFAPKNAEVRSDRDARFGVEVRVAGGKADKRTEDEYKPRLPENTDGVAFVPIKRDDVYGVALVNDADFDAAVQLRIDGLSMYSFSEVRDPKTGAPEYTYVVVPKKSRVFIRGWHVTNAKSDEFKVTEYAKSAAAELRSTAPTGTITATFHAAWDPKGQPPADEPKNPDKNSLSSDATGRGARFDQKFVEVDRDIGVARDVISVRYAK